MFSTAGMAGLYGRHKETLKRVAALGDTLNKRFYGMEDAVHCMMLAAMSGEAMVMIGPPGTAKSRLIRVFCNQLGLLDGKQLVPDVESEEADAAEEAGKATSQETEGEKPEVNEDYFEYLLTEFTEPSELFGFFDMEALHVKHKLQRLETGMMHRAKVVFLDEVFNASSSILNALLAIMNERKFHDRGEVKSTELQLLFSATNGTPTDPVLAAFYDRFLLRCWMKNVPDRREDVANLLEFGWKETHATETWERGNAPFEGLLDQLQAFRRDVDKTSKAGDLRIDKSHELIPLLVELSKTLREQGLLTMSNRRFIKLSGVMLFSALLRAAKADSDDVKIDRTDLEVITKYSIDKDDLQALSIVKKRMNAG